MERTAARRVINAIKSYNSATTFEIQGNTLSVTVPGGLVAEQRELIKTHKPELIAFLTEPPEQSGTCRRGHTIVWKCNPYGLWVCICYFVTPEATEPEQESVPAASPTRNYWKVKEDNISLLSSPITQRATLQKVQSDSQEEYSTQGKIAW